MDKMKKNATATAVDFMRDEDTGDIKAEDNKHVVVGGVISAKSVKFTKNNQAMAYLSIEDLTGTVEVIVFPKAYERYQRFLNQDDKVFVVGRATVEDEQNGKIICERIVPFADTRKELWLQFPTKEEFAEKEQTLYGLLDNSDGADEVVIYTASPKAVKRLGKSRTVMADGALLAQLSAFLGEKNVKCVEKNIENRS
jgi:DNA polymerase-3 subunit alpha